LSEIKKGRLDELAEEIVAEHRAFVSAFRKAVEHGIRAGGLLTEAKGNYEHGKWLPWLKENFKSAARTAQAYMRLYDHRDEIRAKSGLLISSSKDAYLRSSWVNSTLGTGIPAERSLAPNGKGN
jgi:Protein of unknown function (DUF3102)